MIWKALALLGVAAAALGDGHHAVSEQKVVVHHAPAHHGHHGELAHIGSHAPEHHEQYAWSHPSYEFSYRVEDPHTHDFKGQREHRDGDVVKGEYWLLQPDGRKRIVKYHADKHSGFHAEVHYEGEAHHPNHVHHHEQKHNEQKHQEQKHQEPIHHVPHHHAPVQHEPIYHQIHSLHEQLAHREQHGHGYRVHIKHEHKPHHHNHEHHHIPIIHHEHHVHKPHHEHIPEIQEEHKPRHEPIVVHEEHEPVHREHIPIHHEHKSTHHESLIHHEHEPVHHENHERRHHNDEHHPHHIPVLNWYKPKVHEPYYGHRHH